MIVNQEPVKSREELFEEALFDLLELGDVIYISNYFFSSNIKHVVKVKRRHFGYNEVPEITLRSEYGDVWENIGIKDIVSIEGEKQKEFLSLKVLLELSR
jgi:hypothetical protein